MAGSGSSMLYSFLLFTVILSLQEMYRGKLASSELFTILGGFISSLLFLVLLTVSSNALLFLYQLQKLVDAFYPCVISGPGGLFWMGNLQKLYEIIQVLSVVDPVAYISITHFVNT